MAYGAGPFGSTPFAGLGEDSEFTGEILLATAEASSAALPFWIANFLSEADASSTVSTQEIMSLLAEANAVLTPVAGAQFFSALLDEAQASEALRTLFEVLLADEADASSLAAALHTRRAALLAVALASDPLVAAHQAVVALTAAATLADLLAIAADAELEAEAEATEALLAALRANAQLAAEADAAATQTNSLIAVAMLADDASTADAVEAQASLAGFLASGGEAVLRLSIGGEDYSAWVMNLDTLGVTQYQNYGFNSFASFSGAYYGLREDGLYRLSGDDDQGDAIEAWIRTGLSNYGSGSVKRVPDFYLGYTSDGGMVLKVVVTNEGVKDEHWYRLEARDASATRADRAKPGKGLASVYWQWELRNIDGSDFNLDAIRFRPVALTRRVR